MKPINEIAEIGHERLKRCFGQPHQGLWNQAFGGPRRIFEHACRASGNRKSDATLILCRARLHHVAARYKFLDQLAAGRLMDGEPMGEIGYADSRRACVAAAHFHHRCEVFSSETSAARS